ncbi:uncharacterized protein [Argopecten irradians]|uniref:uncharacterized protein n=1 Tax=Argopecten irradians TaxID=31199 RepID=UPI00371538F8
MPPKRRAALQNQYVNATVSKRSRINQASASTATSASGAEPTIPVSSSPEVTMASSQLQGLIREAFEAGMQEARAHIHPPAQPIDVPVPNASAVQTASSNTNNSRVNHIPTQHPVYCNNCDCQHVKCPIHNNGY